MMADDSPLLSLSPPALLPPGACRQLLKAWYYDALLTHAPLRRDLAGVYRALAELDALGRASPGPGPGPGVDDRGLARLSVPALLGLARAAGRAAAEARHEAVRAGVWARRWAAWSPPDSMALFGDQAARWWLARGTGHLGQALTALAERARALRLAAEGAILAALLERYPLPADAAADVRESFALWRALGRPDPPPLVPAPLAADGLSVPRPRPALTARETLDWHPGREGGAAFERAVDTILARVRAALVAHRHATEERLLQAGWERLPPKWHDPAVLAAAARRLMLRTVHGLSWAAIAARTGAEARATVAEQVRDLAARIDLPSRWLSPAAARAAAGTSADVDTSP
jgi:hypothetical protein